MKLSVEIEAYKRDGQWIVGSFFAKVDPALPGAGATDISELVREMLAYAFRLNHPREAANHE